MKVNAPPVPEISGPDVACVNEAITWASDRSTDPDGKISAFRWTLGDGTEVAAASATHRYTKAGRYSMTLFADDGAGLANSRNHITRSIRVNRPPQASAGADRMACPGEAIKFDGSASSDTDGKLTRFSWEFGDGTTREGAQTEHSFAKPGMYQVRLTVTDDSGSTCSSNTAALKVLVKARPVAQSGGDREIWVGGANDAILLDASKSSDPDGHALNFAWRRSSPSPSILGALKLERVDDARLGDLRVKREQHEPSVEVCARFERLFDSVFHLARELRAVRGREAFRAEHAIGDDFRCGTIGLRCRFAANRLILK